MSTPLRTRLFGTTCVVDRSSYVAPLEIVSRRKDDTKMYRGNPMKKAQSTGK
jgi:hypothetical protein